MDKTDSHSDSELKEIYKLKNIAVVGISNKYERAGHFVPKYLIEHGYNIIPVNPNIKEVFGRKSHQDINSIEENVDIVDIFRKSEDILPVVKDAIKKQGVKAIWMQEELYNEEAEKLALQNNIVVIFNRCMMAEHKRLFD